MCDCRHDLLTECRILLLHGLLHLLGWDHELGPEQADSMAAAERRLLAELGWQGSGLISAGNAATDPHQSPAAAADGEVSNSQPLRRCMPCRACLCVSCGCLCEASRKMTPVFCLVLLTWSTSPETV